MLARLEIELETDAVNYRSSSALQGVLFEQMDTAYAELLHTQNMHPYSQYVIRAEGRTVWVIQTLNRQAYQEIILPLLDADFREITLRREKVTHTIAAKRTETLLKKELMEQFYHEEADAFFSARFLSATAFKQSGNYYILPDVRLLFQNLMMKYSASSDRVDMSDDDALEELMRSAFITRHQLRSVVFPLEGVKIPGFIGVVNLRVRAGETLRRYVRLLLRFAEFSGIGIKTAMGMGAFELEKRVTQHG